MIAHCLYIANTDEMGRGVFTSEDISKGSVIEIAPVIVMSANERKFLDKTLLHDYIFEWGEDSSQCCMALGWAAVYNHTYQSNCNYEMDYEKHTITIKTVRKVKAGEELFINYSGSWDATKAVWFDAK
ncbi:SET domain-containing protein [Niabella ginsengisoli]|uniref:SET domain-containing protein n=1 Tax=Niabella ginsengisoli TaxID=522298 RepID=A0ABS9SIF5_9BACT|nr:SET domain-containing protein [Niabella ginsengisoli]MCH5598163.1 SET domain-containing protein [Niabella ginsengisoli]